jgi:hypothetical protein
MYWFLDEFFNRGRFLVGGELDFAKLQDLFEVNHVSREAAFSSNHFN